MAVIRFRSTTRNVQRNMFYICVCVIMLNMFTDHTHETKTHIHPLWHNTGMLYSNHFTNRQIFVSARIPQIAIGVRGGLHDRSRRTAPADCADCGLHRSSPFECMMFASSFSAHQSHPPSPKCISTYNKVNVTQHTRTLARARVSSRSRADHEHERPRGDEPTRKSVIPPTERPPQNRREYAHTLHPNTAPHNPTTSLSHTHAHTRAQ